MYNGKIWFGLWKPFRSFQFAYLHLNHALETLAYWIQSNRCWAHGLRIPSTVCEP